MTDKERAEIKIAILTLLIGAGDGLNVEEAKKIYAWVIETL